MTAHRFESIARLEQVELQRITPGYRWPVPELRVLVYASPRDVPDTESGRAVLDRQLEELIDSLEQVRRLIRDGEGNGE